MLTKVQWVLKLKLRVLPHSSLPNLGHNAIDDIIRYIQKSKEKYEDIKIMIINIH